VRVVRADPIQAARLSYGSSADKTRSPGHVRFGPERDISPTSSDVRFVQQADSCTAARRTSTAWLHTKALSPVIALPTINVFISRVPS
jgi:hypothetical protein